ncbi:MBL fold metallo-hydrolase [Myxococcota bacterium]|nr:MBL fold metallo-hydrolase [Myxococcota bacterium]MBU1380849.1 MBL fold metallo-hydrolase [Myxococcota bacterium]MBU1499146.1 MBL fold metallo-hydrolase [Myxococcota bacterium]
MQIRVWGARGSYISPQKSYALYGGNTTCLELTHQNGNRLILDAGSGIIPFGRKVAMEEDENREYHLLLTHTHIDHLQGFPFFLPIHLRKTKIIIHCGRWDVTAVSKTFERLFATQYSPIKTIDNLSADITFSEMDELSTYNVNGFDVTPVRTQHTTDTFAYLIKDNSQTSFGFITDHEIDDPIINNRLIESFSGCNLVFHDGQLDTHEYFDQKGWGHSTVEKAVRNGLDMSVAHFGLFHHSPDHQDTVIDSMKRDILSDYNETMKISFVAEGQLFEV